jgi:hypothetical protein
MKIGRWTKTPKNNTLSHYWFAYFVSRVGRSGLVSSLFSAPPKFQALKKETKTKLEVLLNSPLFLIPLYIL